jgi:hypothetical protein
MPHRTPARRPPRPAQGAACGRAGALVGRAKARRSRARARARAKAAPRRVPLPGRWRARPRGGGRRHDARRRTRLARLDVPGALAARGYEVAPRLVHQAEGLILRNARLRGFPGRGWPFTPRVRRDERQEAVPDATNDAAAREPRASQRAAAAGPSAAGAPDRACSGSNPGSRRVHRSSRPSSFRSWALHVGVARAAPC